MLVPLRRPCVMHFRTFFGPGKVIDINQDRASVPCNEALCKETRYNPVPRDAGNFVWKDAATELFHVIFDRSTQIPKPLVEGGSRRPLGSSKRS